MPDQFPPSRSLWLPLLAAVLAAFAAVRAFLALPLLFAPSVGLWTPAALAVQAVSAALLAAGLWFRRSWTIAALWVFAAVIAASALIESFAIGMRPALQGAAIAIAVVIGAILLARALERSS